jgi:hypothetical protein
MIAATTPISFETTAAPKTAHRILTRLRQSVHSLPLTNTSCCGAHGPLPNDGRYLGAEPAPQAALAPVADEGLSSQSTCPTIGS